MTFQISLVEIVRVNNRNWKTDGIENPLIQSHGRITPCATIVIQCSTHKSARYNVQ